MGLSADLSLYYTFTLFEIVDFFAIQIMRDNCSLFNLVDCIGEPK